MKSLKAKDELLWSGISAALLFGHQSCVMETEFCNFDFMHSTGDDIMNHREKPLVLFSSKMSTRVLNEVMRYLPEFEPESATSFEFVQGINLTL